LLLLVLALALAIPSVVAAQSAERGNTGDELPTFKSRSDEGAAVPGQLIVKYKESAGQAEQATIRRQEGLEIKEELGLIDAEVVRVEGRSVAEAARDLNLRADVEYAEPDFIQYPAGYADEPRFAELWGLHNTGQTISGSPGTANVDVNGLEASSRTLGSPSLVVAVIDDGVDFSHPDLSARAWKNPGESGSGKETNGVDDGNGFVDDVNGWDFCGDDNTVHDAEDFHGTHVSGTIAGSINNRGVVGVAPNVKIMALKFLCEEGGSNSDNILAIQYAKSKGVKLSNNSYGCTGCFSQALKDAIDASGSLFVASAGNGGGDGVGDDNDVTPHYPDGYTSSNILSVAAINNNGNLGGFSNFGATSVDISAPGVSVLSSIPGSPSMSAMTLSSVSTSGKAVTAGFGADEIGNATKRASFFTKAFTAVGRGTQQVVLVDDDRSSTNSAYPDARASISAAIQSSTGTAPEVIDVNAESNGPALSQLSGKTVVWATGQAFSSGAAGTTLTATDQTTLTNFLNGGGKLVLTGMDALWLIESSTFVTGTLKLNADSDITGKTTFSGSSGTAFAGESYALNSATALSDYHDHLDPANSSAVSQGVYPGTASSWAYFNGTSMAAPHVTGAAALAASKYPSLKNNPVFFKKVLMDSGKRVSATVGKTVTGDMVDAQAALFPRVTVTSPRPNATGFPRTDNITATFSEAMNSTTIKATTFILTADCDDAAPGSLDV
jgi:subtilisin family serine protease